MKVILLQEVIGLGSPGDIVEVKDGHGRNFLLPQKKAEIATKGAQKQVEAIRRSQAARAIRDLDEARVIQSSLLPLQVRVMKPAGASGRLFGAVTGSDLISAVRNAGGPELDKRRVQLASQVKSVGKHRAAVVLHPEVTVNIDFEVVPLKPGKKVA